MTLFYQNGSTKKNKKKSDAKMTTFARGRNWNEFEYSNIVPISSYHFHFTYEKYDFWITRQALKL